METLTLKNHVLDIAHSVTEKTKVEDIFAQFQMLLDIEESENQIQNNEVYSHEAVKNEAATWLK